MPKIWVARTTVNGEKKEDGLTWIYFEIISAVPDLTSSTQDSSTATAAFSTPLNPFYVTPMARFSYQNSTISLVFKVWHSFLKFVIRFSRLTFVFFSDSTFVVSTLRFVSFFWAFVFQLWHSFYSNQHSFS